MSMKNIYINNVDIDNNFSMLLSIREIFISIIRKNMNVKECLERIAIAQKERLMTRFEIADELGITYPTLLRIEKLPDQCSLQTLKKIKKFMERLEIEKLSATH